MEKISRNNYEGFFLDYLEGNLDPLKTEELFFFLLYHPDLKKELDEFEFITLGDSENKFDNKANLKKFNFTDEINDFNFEQFCIALIEDDLNEQQKIKFNNYLISNPEKERILEQYKHIRLNTDSSIVYFGKDKLKKRSLGGLIILKRLVVAASLLLVAGLSFFFITKINTADVHLISENKNSAEKISPVHQISTIPVIETHETIIEVANLDKHSLVSNELVLYEESTEENIKVNRIILKPILNRTPELDKHTGEAVLFASMTKTEINYYDDSSSRDLLAGLRRNIDELGSTIDTEGIDGSGRLTIWDIADAGINGFSKLTGADVRVEKKRDEDGNVTALAFQSRNLNFTKRINY